MAPQEWHPATSDLYVHLHTHTLTHIHTYMFVCTHPHTHINTFIHAHLHIHIHTNTSITHSYASIVTHACALTHTCAYSHIYTPVYPHTYLCPVTHMHACLETRGVGRLGLSTSPLWGLLVGTCPLWVHVAFVLWVCITHFPVNSRSFYGYQPVKLD